MAEDRFRYAVRGFCPMGCGSTLWLAVGGHITCGYLDCPDPDAVSTLLADRETEHVVEVGETTFTVRHPLRERIGDGLMRCALHDHLAGLDGPPVAPGRYRAEQDGLRWSFAAIGGGTDG